MNTRLHQIHAVEDIIVRIEYLADALEHLVEGGPEHVQVAAADSPYRAAAAARATRILGAAQELARAIQLQVIDAQAIFREEVEEHAPLPLPPGPHLPPRQPEGLK